MADAQEQLRDIPLVERLYGLSLREIDQPVRPFSVETALQGSHQGSIVSDYVIPGVFTYEGWKGPFQIAMARVLEGLGNEAWVVGRTRYETDRSGAGHQEALLSGLCASLASILESLGLGPCHAGEYGRVCSPP